MKRTASIQLGVILLLSVTLLPLPPASGAPPRQAPPVTPDEYDRWETLGGGTLSPDGAWLAVTIGRVDGTSELRLHEIAAPDAAPRIIEEGSSPRFSADARWLAYGIGYSEAEREQARGGDQPLRNKVGLLDLRTGDEGVFDDVRSFGFDDTGAFLWMSGYPAEGRDAADLVVRDLAAGTSLNFGNVSAHAWQDDAPRLAMTVATASNAGNGVQLWDATTGMLVPLDSGDATFTGLTWREDAADLAVLRSAEEPGFEEPTHVVLAWRDLDDGVSELLRFDHRTLDPAIAALPTARDSSGTRGSSAVAASRMRVVEHRSPIWSGDGRVIFVGVREWTEKPEAEESGATGETDDEGAADDAARREDAAGGDEETSDSGGAGTSDEAADEPEPADVDVWHARDERIIPMQKLQEERDRARSYLSAWHIDDGRLVRLGSDYHESIALLEGDRYATETDRTPYLVDGMFGRRWVDVDLIDVNTGERTRVVDRVRYFSGGSATGERLLYFKDDQHFAYDIATGEHVDLTASLPTSFVNEDYDFPVEQKPSWGVAGWAEDDEAVLLYDRYDVWSVAPDGSGARRLTDGAQDEIRYRHVDPAAGPFSFGASSEPIDLDRPLWLTMFGEWTKKSGYARLDLSRADAGPEPIVWLDKGVGRLVKAEDTEVFAYVVQAFDDSPDYFVGGPQLANATQITHTNPFQSEFAWGHAELIDYSCEFGPRVQGALMYPADYQQDRTYPMITYVYEKLSQRVHGYSVPSERSPYNPAVWTSRGYFVLMPDIVYRGRMPGTSAVECIRPAVRTVIDTGLVDADRVGLVGHSWGGYEAAFVPTKTDIFAASVSGAALTNFFSMFGTIHWNQGMPESSHWETGQARMDVPYWDDMDAYIRESPVIGIPDLETPMLMAFGDADGTVDFHQGVEMYNYARRAGKQFVLLVYADENHSNRQKKNQIDYHHRVLDWFGHYLKGEPAEKWITEGVSVIERNDQIKREERR